MTSASALELLDAVRRCGGRLVPEGDGLRVRLPDALAPRLLPAIRERKHDLLVLLRRPDGDCLGCGAANWWQDSAGAWHCGHCEPDPRMAAWRGISMADIGNRDMIGAPPTADLPTPGMWSLTPAGWATVLAWTPDGMEVLVRLFHTPAGHRPFCWYRDEQVSAEWEAELRPAQRKAQ